MKRSLVIVPFLLLILLNACDPFSRSFTPQEWTAIANTQTAMIWTPTITGTPNPDEKLIVFLLNEELSKADPLEKSMDATFRVLDVEVKTDSNNYSVLRVFARCECVTSGCCSSERIFVKIIGAMKQRQADIFEQLPTRLIYRLEVICSDHMASLPTMAVEWSNVREYFNDTIGAEQFGYRVTRVP